MKIAAVVVTYNRKNILAKCLDALLKQTRKLDAIFVIDNASTDGTKEMVKEIFPQIIYKRLFENIGASGGFSEGLKIAYNRGFDWIWGMDDDAMPFRNSLEKILLHNISEKSIYVSKMVSDLSGNNNSNSLTEIKDFMFIGFLLSRKAISQAGYPRSDFFIYWDDIEYSRRLLNYKFKIYRVNDSLILHKDWANLPLNEYKLFFFKSIFRQNYSPWKNYYLYRNKILCKKSLKAFDSCKYKILKEYSIEFLLRFFVGDFISAFFIIRGLTDGLLNRSGKIVIPK